MLRLDTYAPAGHTILRVLPESLWFRFVFFPINHPRFPKASSGFGLPPDIVPTQVRDGRGAVDGHALCLPRAQAPGNTELCLARVGVSAILQTSTATDTADAPTQGALSGCRIVPISCTGDLDFLSLVGAVKGTGIAERTELGMAAEKHFGEHRRRDRLAAVSLHPLCQLGCASAEFLHTALGKIAVNLTHGRIKKLDQLGILIPQKPRTMLLRKH